MSEAMKRRSLWFIGIAGGILIAVAVWTLLPREAGPAQAAGTQIFLTRPGHTAPETFLGMIGGGPESVDVYVQDVKDPEGLATFEFTITFDGNLVSVTSVALGPFLGSTGRPVTCTTPVIDINSVNYSCNTLVDTPLGPQGSGVLATIFFQQGSAPGTSPLTFSSTLLGDTTVDVNPIPHTATNSAMIVAPCGSFNGDNVVTILDIMMLVSRFGTFEGGPGWDPQYDLNADGSITTGDILIEVQEFGLSCPA